MPTSHGSFVWYDLATGDPQKATAFYRDVVGWGAQDSGTPDMDYTLLTVAGAPVTGVMAMPEHASQAGARPRWSGYIAVDNVDASAARIEQAGGAVHRPPADIPGVGRFAVVSDPQHAAFIVFKGASEPPPASPPSTPGHVGWHELHTTEPEAAFAFYSGLFGWTKGELMDLGPMGGYQLFATGGEAVGGIMAKAASVPAPFWNYYFSVPAIDAAAARVTAAGGRILSGPHQVPGGSWIVQGLDPQDVTFALTAPSR